MKNLAVGAFRALSIFNFRVWTAGALGYEMPNLAP